MAEGGLPVVAVCERCGREFVWMRPDDDLVDHYPTWAPCGGRVVLTDTGHAAIAEARKGMRDG